MKILICAPLQDAEIKKIQEHFKNDIFIINRKPTQENIDQVDVIIGNPKLNLSTELAILPNCCWWLFLFIFQAVNNVFS